MVSRSTVKIFISLMFLEIIYRVKKGGSFPIRPDIITDVPDVNPTLIALVKDCWAEAPEDRPTAENICEQLRDLMPKFVKFFL